jgi:hypothetical protein
MKSSARSAYNIETPSIIDGGMSTSRPDLAKPRYSNKKIHRFDLWELKKKKLLPRRIPWMERQRGLFASSTFQRVYFEITTIGIAEMIINLYQLLLRPAR